MAADSLAILKLGANQHAQKCAPSQEEAAKLFNVSRRNVQYAVQISKASIATSPTWCVLERVNLHEGNKLIELARRSPPHCGRSVSKRR